MGDIYTNTDGMLKESFSQTVQYFGSIDKNLIPIELFIDKMNDYCFSFYGIHLDITFKWLFYFIKFEAFNRASLVKLTVCGELATGAIQINNLNKVEIQKILFTTLKKKFIKFLKYVLLILFMVLLLMTGYFFSENIQSAYISYSRYINIITILVSVYILSYFLALCYALFNIVRFRNCVIKPIK